MYETLFIGKNVIHLPEINSTNDYARLLLSEKKQLEGTIIFTDKQTQGRGQMGNEWDSEPGKNLTLSIILYPTFLPIDRQFFLNMAISLAVKEFCESLTREFVQIKWPNDILINNKKAAGILIENSIHGSKIASSVIGIGININQTNFPENLANATSVLNNSPANTAKFELKQLLQPLSFYLEKYYMQLKQEHYHFLTKAYKTSMWRYNQTHEFMKGKQIFKGEISGVGKDGKLEIDVNGKVQRFAFKEVAFIY